MTWLLARKFLYASWLVLALTESVTDGGTNGGYFSVEFQCKGAPYATVTAWVLSYDVIPSCGVDSSGIATLCTRSACVQQAIDIYR